VFHRTSTAHAAQTGADGKLRLTVVSQHSQYYSLLYLLLNYSMNSISCCFTRKVLNNMPNIKPISDLRNYGEVLRDVTIGAPVFLTKNGHGRYAVLDIDEYKEYEKMLAWRKLKSELDKGRRSGEENGWVSACEVKAHFEERYRGRS